MTTAIKTSEEKVSRVVQLWESDSLLIRGVDVFSIRNSRVDRKPEIDEEKPLTQEMEALAEEGLFALSTTLIVKGERVSVYRGAGYLLNGTTGNTFHYAATDSGSSGQGDDFRANKSDLTSLESLAASVRATKSGDMTEVNGNFRQTDVVGLFCITGRKPTNMLSGLVAQKILQERGLDLPLFLYDPSAGTMSPLDLTDQKIADVINQCVGRRQEQGEMFAAKLDVLDTYAKFHSSSTERHLEGI